MSGSSYAQRHYTRCTVGLNAGISISWAPDPDGSYEHGQRHHRNEEARFLARLEAGRAAIEVLFDELEATGRVFTAPDAAGFANAQRADTGMPIVSVTLHCVPPLSEAELAALVKRVADAVAEPPPQPPAIEAPPEPAPAAAPPKPWWKVW